MGTCTRCGKTRTGKVPIANAGAPRPAFICTGCEPDALVPYVGGTLEGSYTFFPQEGLVLDGVYEECPIPAGTDKAERYILRRGEDGWVFVYAGPAD